LRAVFFDLDDTLYPEIQFVISGFRAVGDFLGRKYAFSSDAVLKRCLELLSRNGRGKVFDDFLSEAGLVSEINKLLLVYIYRSHTPTIFLPKESDQCLTRLREAGYRLGIITDGMASVQRRKIQALGLLDKVDVCICSDELEKRCWKPSQVPFLMGLEMLNCGPSETVYVGDNPKKDFHAANSLGMTTIQIVGRTPICESLLTNNAAEFLAHHQVREILEVFSMVQSYSGSKP